MYEHKVKFAVQMGNVELFLECHRSWIDTVSNFDYKALNLWRFLVSACKSDVLWGIQSN